MPPTISPVVRTLLLVTVVIWVLVELRQAQGQRPEAHVADAGSRPIIRVTSVIAVAGAFLVRRYVPSTVIMSEAIASWIGLILVWCGMALRFWSFHTLGRYFTFTVQTSADQPVVDAGPYRVIRHPSYAAILLTMMGLGLIIGNWLSFAVLIVGISCGIVYRIRVEERALSQDLGGRYQDYAAGRKRLVPFLW